MSIAVSAVVQPSRILFWLLVMMCMNLLFIAGLIACGSMASLSIETRVALAMICAAIALYAFFRMLTGRRAYEIQISGTGQIRLAVLQRKQRLIDDDLINEQAEVVHLLPVSTLWSGLLLLHLQNEQKKIHVVTILPDSVQPESFKALLVACRWIVLRHAGAENQRKAGN